MPSKAARVAFLLLTMLVVTFWAVGRSRTRQQRRTWERPVEVAVLLLEGAGPTEPVALANLGRSLERLASRLAEERRRHDPGAEGPAFHVELIGPLRTANLPPVEPPDEGLLDRALHAFDLWRAGREAHAAARALAPPGALPFDPAVFDVRVLLVVDPAATQFAEGIGEAGGEVAVVRAGLAGDGLLAATAALHEVLHCLGATDKYDASGHAVVPGGLVEPELVPRFPQRLAELMVGEIPLGPGRGRLPASAAELGIGEATAREIGWRAPR